MRFKMTGTTAGLTEGERRKKRFARNLQQLVELAGMNLKVAAEEIGVPYPWVRRMATTGIGRSDAKNRANLDRVAAYFVLPSIDQLWQDHLVVDLLTSPEGKEFVGKFHDSLARLCSQESEKLRSVDLLRLEAIRKAINFIELPLPRITNPRTVLMAFIEDCGLSGLKVIAEKWLEHQVEHQVESAAPLRNGTDNGLCM